MEPKDSSSSSGEDCVAVSTRDSDDDCFPQLGQSPPNSQDAVCMFCDRKYSDDCRGELWIQCLVCDMWAHIDCAGSETDNYVCDYCKIN